MSGEKETRTRWLVRLLKASVALLVLACVYGTFRSALDELGDFDWTVHPLWLLGSGGLYLAGLFPCAVFWYFVLRALRQEPAAGAAIRAYYIGHLGKYVPGKALVVVLRTWLIRGPRVETAAAVVSVLVETLTMMAVGSFWAATILMVVFPGQYLLIVLAAALMVLAGVPTVPPILRRLLKRVPERWTGGSGPIAAERLSWPLMAGGWLGISLGWALLGLSLWAALRALDCDGLQPVGDLPLLTATVSLAMVVGFLSGIPGGVMVREGILWTLLAQHLSPVMAVAAAVLLRLVWLGSELAIAGLLYVTMLGASRANGKRVANPEP